MPGRTVFLGEVKTRDIAPVYAACDLTVWPAINEAYGMALLEAQAAGLPVVSCAMRGVPDVVADGETGILVKDSDFEALARELRGLLLDHERRRGLGRGAAAFVLRERSLEMAAGFLRPSPDSSGMTLLALLRHGETAWWRGPHPGGPPTSR